MYESPSWSEKCSPGVSFSSHCSLSVPQSVRSVSQPETRTPTPRPNLSAGRAISRFRNTSTPCSSQFFSNTNDPLTTLLDEDTNRCSDVDHQVKLALTDLLNCSDVKSDAEVRLWVQNRLMAVEQRLKARRRSHIVNGEH